MQQTIATKTKSCSFCLAKGIMRQARFEGRTEDGDWTYMCFKHYAQHGTGMRNGNGRRLTKLEEEK